LVFLVLRIYGINEIVSETRPGVYGAHYPNDRDNIVTEPHTGLAANPEKYGNVQGGTDGNPNIHAIQPGQHGTTDWDAIKKADTAY
jgi:hypothetical protein